jgi:hypothetical protein
MYKDGVRSGVTLPIAVFRLNLRVSQMVSAPAAFLGCGAVSQAPSPESNPNSSLPVTTMFISDVDRDHSHTPIRRLGPGASPCDPL